MHLSRSVVSEDGKRRVRSGRLVVASGRALAGLAAAGVAAGVIVMTAEQVTQPAGGTEDPSQNMIVARWKIL